MWWLIQNIIFSVCLIVIIHYLYIYFETTLTSPKIKDLIHCPKQEYKILLESVHKKMDRNDILRPQDSSPNVDESLTQKKHIHSPVETLGMNNIPTDNMKVDLKEYLRELALKTN